MAAEKAPGLLAQPWRARYRRTSEPFERQPFERNVRGKAEPVIE